MEVLQHCNVSEHYARRVIWQRHHHRRLISTAHGSARFEFDRSKQFVAPVKRDGAAPVKRQRPPHPRWLGAGGGRGDARRWLGSGDGMNGLDLARRHYDPIALIAFCIVSNDQRSFVFLAPASPGKSQVVRILLRSVEHQVAHETIFFFTIC